MTKPFAVYDTRHYTTLDANAGYELWSHTYDHTVDEQLDIPLLAKLETVNWKSIQTVVDLACGTGRIGLWLHSQGIRYIHGVDSSPAMLQYAAAKQVYEQLYATDVIQSSLPSHSYDLSFIGLAACHLPDLQALYTEGARLLRPGGFFVLIDYHPFCLLQGIPTHFDSAKGKAIAIENLVHFISDHVNSGRRVNLTLLEMHEAFVDQDWIAHKPNMARYVNQPISFVMVWRADTS
jgi:SAM-dependent methyltransferase